MNPSTTHDGIPPDLEDLAAYLDGLLADDRRAAVEARLAQDPEYYEVFLDTMRFREEEGLDDSEELARAPQATVISSAATLTKWSPALALAAGLLLALVWRPWQPSLEEQFQAQIQPREAVLEAFEHPRGWAVYRSADPSLLVGETRSESFFRLGTHLVNLDLAFKANTPQSALYYLRQLDTRLHHLHLRNTIVGYMEDSIQDQIEAGRVKVRSESTGLRILHRELTWKLKRDPEAWTALRWGRWSEQVLLLYLGGHLDLLEMYLDDPPKGFKDREEVTEAVRSMVLASKEKPTEGQDTSEFIEAHQRLEGALGGR